MNFFKWLKREYPLRFYMLTGSEYRILVMSSCFTGVALAVTILLLMVNLIK